jgi:hypothetical protein
VGSHQLMRKIFGSETFKAPMCTLFNMLPGPPVGTPLSVHAPLESIKGRAHTLEHKLSQVPQDSHKFHGHSIEFTHTRKLTLTQSQLFLTKTSNTSHSGRTVDVGFYVPAA